MSTDVTLQRSHDSSRSAIITSSHRTIERLLVKVVTLGTLPADASPPGRRLGTHRVPNIVVAFDFIGSGRRRARGANMGGRLVFQGQRIGLTTGLTHRGGRSSHVEKGTIQDIASEWAISLISLFTTQLYSTRSTPIHSLANDCTGRHSVTSVVTYRNGNCVCLATR